MTSPLDEPFGDVMPRQLGGTTWSALEVFMLGEALLNSLAAVAVLGHANPGSNLDYRETGMVGSRPHDLLSDYIAWCSGRTEMRPGCEERIRHELAESGWTRYAMERVSDQLDWRRQVSPQ